MVVQSVIKGKVQKGANEEDETPATDRARVIDLVFPIIVLIAICVYGLYYLYIHILNKKNAKSPEEAEEKVEATV